MFHKGIVILNAYIAYPGLSNLADRLIEEGAKKGLSISRKTNAEIFSYVKSNGSLSKANLKADFIIYLDKDPYIAKILEKNHFRLFNHAEAIRLCDDKMLTYLSLLNLGIKMPKTISAPLCYDRKDNLAFIDNLEKELSYPFVSKTNFGSQGKGVSLISSREELIAREKEIAFSPRLYQEMVRGEKGTDYRLIVIGGKLIASMKRVNQSGDFRSNVALGGEGIAVSPPSSFEEVALKAASALNLDYCGVDILKNEHEEPVLCEVNSNAFIAGIEKATKINVASAYIEHIMNCIY